MARAPPGSCRRSARAARRGKAPPGGHPSRSRCARARPGGWPVPPCPRSEDARCPEGEAASGVRGGRPARTSTPRRPPGRRRTGAGTDSQDVRIHRLRISVARPRSSSERALRGGGGARRCEPKHAYGAATYRRSASGVNQSVRKYQVYQRLSLLDRASALRASSGEPGSSGERWLWLCLVAEEGGD